MKQHKNKEFFRVAIIATSQLKNTAEIYIEKARLHKHPLTKQRNAV